MPYDSAAARAHASETPNIAFAPKFFLNGVPSNCNNTLSIPTWSSAYNPIISGAMISLTFFTAFKTPLPKYLDLSPSLSSKASLSPVEAPLGTIALPTVPSSKVTSTSTVGLPRESKTSRA